MDNNLYEKAGTVSHTLRDIGLCVTHVCYLNMPLKFVKSQKGKQILINDGYVHLYNKKGSDKFIWRCVDY